MTFHAVKFKVDFLNTSVPVDPRVAELVQWGKIFYEKKLAPFVNGVSAGNLSFRCLPGEKEFVITGSQLGFNNNLSNSDFVRVVDCSPENFLVTACGTREPSSESMLHAAIYQNRTDLNCILHGHSEEILKNSSRLKLIATKTVETYGSFELAESVLKVLEKNNFVVLKGHGFVSLGRTIKEAGERAVTILASCI